MNGDGVTGLCHCVVLRVVYRLARCGYNPIRDMHMFEVHY